MDAASGDSIWWISGFEKDYPTSYRIPYVDHPFYLAQLNNWKEGKKYAVMAVSYTHLLGLSLSYDIVKAHGGEISVVSMDEPRQTDSVGQSVARGTEFIIELPI